MTQSECLDCLRELRAVERLMDAVAVMMRDPHAAPEWKYGATALDDRWRWLRYCLSLEHPLMISSVDELLNAETMRARSTRSEPPPTMTPDVPTGGRVH